MDKSYIHYQDSLKLKEREWDELCIRCGGCCGAYDDPCKHLREDETGSFYCEVYDQRFGTQKTVSGEAFDCVLVKQILHTYWKKDHLCAYKQYLKMPWKTSDSKKNI
ncbi:MAG: hypothetical protein K9L86_07450 [Candidatus Omnitrophica bacterium]|nr:hypothetical protein [Candidatus Omnitrophota bacterium]